MKASTTFAVRVKCEHCDGTGHRFDERTVDPCRECGHDVEYEHSIEDGWTYDKTYGGYDSYAQCMIEGCKCSIKIPHEGWPGRKTWSDMSFIRRDP